MSTINTQQRHEILFLTCPPRSASSLVDELMDKLDASEIEAHVLKYGIAAKGHDGFVIIACPQGFPQDFLQSLHRDEEIRVFVVLSMNDPYPQVALLQTVQEFGQWLQLHHLRLVSNEETGGLRIVPDDSSDTETTSQERQI